MKKLYNFFAILFFVGINLYSQTITTSPLPGSEFCAGQSINVSYTSQGQFQNDNLFVVQLSNNNFQNFANIGNLKSTLSGTVSALIPSDFQKSTTCRIRVISTNPYIEGSDNGSDISIYPQNYGSVNISSDKIIGSVDSLFKFSFTYDSLNTSTAIWNFGEGAVPASFIGFKPPVIKYLGVGKKIITCEAVSSLNCSNIKTSSTSIYVYGCEATIDTNAVIDSLANSDEAVIYGKLKKLPQFSQLWMLPGSSLFNFGSDRNTVYILESGVTLTVDNSVNSIFYLKPGASLIARYSMYNAFIKSPGANLLLSDSKFNQVVECNSIKINYSAAPQGGVEYMVAGGYLDVGENLAFTKDFSISPNPATDYIEISVGAEHTIPLQIRIYDVFGELVNLTPTLSIRGEGDSSSQYSLLNTQYSTKIDVSSLSPGLYFVRVGEKVGKFLKI